MAAVLPRSARRFKTADSGVTSLSAISQPRRLMIRMTFSVPWIRGHRQTRGPGNYYTRPGRRGKNLCEGQLTMHLARFPRVRLFPAPTPLHRLENLTRELGGPEIWIKRDDCTVVATGGNKVRKLEWLIGDARSQGATHIVTQGA